MKVKKETVLNFIFSCMAILAVFLAWIAAYFAVGNDLVVPSLSDTFAQIWRLLWDIDFWNAFFGTLWRTVEAFLLSFALSALLALVSCVVRAVRAFLSPVVSILRTVPTMAVVLILLLWTSPAVAPVVIAVLVLFPVLYASMLSALDEVKREYGEMASVFGIKKTRQAAYMYLPLAAPPVLSQLGAALSLGLKITVSGEVLSATAKSLGSMMQQAQGFLEIPRLIALTLLAVALGFLFEGLFALAAYFLGRKRA